MTPADVIDALRQAFEPGLTHLVELGFVYTPSRELVSPGTGYTVVGEYSNARTNRAVRLSYLLGTDEAGRPTDPWGLVRTFVTELVPGADCPFDTGEMSVCHPAMWELDGSPPVRVAVHFQEAGQLLGKRFREVLAGGAWSPDPFDIDKVCGG